MDREHADFQQVIEELRVRFGSGVVPVQLPIGQEAAFQGVVDLLALHMKIVTHDDEDLIADIPEYIQADVEAARQQLIESVAEFNNELLEKYIDGKEITELEVTAALIEGIQAGKIFPVFCGAAKANIGVKKLMNGIVEYMPTPYFKVAIGTDPKNGDLKERHTEDAFSAQVFKTFVDPFVGRLSLLRILSGTMRSDASYYHRIAIIRSASVLCSLCRASGRRISRKQRPAILSARQNCSPSRREIRSVTHRMPSSMNRSPIRNRCSRWP